MCAAASSAALAERDDASHVFRAAATAFLLAATDDEGRVAGAASDVERADAFGSVELVAREAEEVDGRVLQGDGDFAHGLNRVGVEVGTLRAGDGGGFLHREEDAGLVVGPHERDDGGVVADGGAEVFEVEETGGVDREPGDLETTAGEAVAEVLGRAVLDAAGDDVAAVAVGLERAVESGVVALAAAAREDEFGGVAIDQRGDLLAGGVERAADAAAEAVGAGGIAVEVGQVGQHRLDDRGIKRRGGVVVEVDDRRRHRRGRFKIQGRFKVQGAEAMLRRRRKIRHLVP